MAATAAAATAAAAAPSVVFQADTSAGGAYPCTRIPAALALPDGALLAFAECRRWAGDQCFVRGVPNATRGQEFDRSICLRRSADGGASWGALQPNVTKRFSANPSAVLVPHPAGGGGGTRVLLFFDDTVSGELYSAASDDGGATWAVARPLLSSASGAPIQGTAGPGNSAVALPGGELLLAAYHADRARTTMFSYASVLRSADGGGTWADVSPPSAAGGGPMFPHLGEPSLAVLPGGLLVLDARCPDGRKPYPGPAAPCDCDCRGVAVSSDGGRSWGETAFDGSVVPDPDCQGALIALANGSLAFSNANSPSVRVNPAVRLGEATAAGVAWAAGATQLATGATSAGYSSIFEAADGRLGVLWETEGGQPGCHGEGCSIVLSFL